MPALGGVVTDSILERPKRKTIARSEWMISAQLVRDGEVVTSAASPLPISDAQLNGNFEATARAIGIWLDDQAQRQSRSEQAFKKSGKRR
jgi:hypothetical protein